MSYGSAASKHRLGIVKAMGVLKNTQSKTKSTTLPMRCDLGPGFIVALELHFCFHFPTFHGSMERASPPQSTSPAGAEVVTRLAVPTDIPRARRWTQRVVLVVYAASSVPNLFPLVLEVTVTGRCLAHCRDVHISAVCICTKDNRTIALREQTNISSEGCRLECTFRPLPLRLVLDRIGFTACLAVPLT